MTMLVASAPVVLGKEAAIKVQVLVTGSDGRSVLEVSGETTPPVISHGTIKISPKLCEGGYQFSVTVAGLGEQRYHANVRGAELNGQPRACPYAGLPDRGLRLLKVLAIVNRNNFTTFNARPRTSAGATFSALKVLNKPRYHIEALGPGRTEIRVRARYKTGRVYVATLLADIGG